MYRGLGLLTKVRVLSLSNEKGENVELVPVHVVCAVKSANGLGGLIE